MHQLHATGRSVDLLAAGTTATHEGFLQILLAQMAGNHPREEFVFLHLAYAEAPHGYALLPVGLRALSDEF